MHNQEHIKDNNQIFLMTWPYTTQDQQHQIDQVNTYISISEPITKATPTSCYNNKACTGVHNITTYARPLLINHYQAYKCNNQVNPHNPTQPSGQNNGSQVISNFI